VTSKRKPPIQNIPIRTPEGEAIRRAFKPPVLVGTNYSQIEMRVLEHVHKDLYHRTDVLRPPCVFCELEAAQRLGLSLEDYRAQVALSDEIVQELIDEGESDG
jgi:DNA polymerase-1